MNVALAFNARRHDGEDHAEFDTPETIALIEQTLRGLGHRVTPLEVTRPVDEVARALRRLAPELVFTIAEGERGTFREALVPALCDQLGLACTGSSASVLALTLDKALAKRVVAAAGVAVPRGAFVRASDDVTVPLPAIVKPNFEGSSKGITQASVVTELARLRPAIEAALRAFPAGVLVEELVPGEDVAVAFLAGEVLAPVRYAYRATGPHRIYDAVLKRDDRAAPLEDVASPFADVLRAAAATAFGALGVTGYARADFRVTPEGRCVFLEVNALPSLAPTNNELYRSRSAREVIAAIVGATITG
ncbi:MAG TPA: hypothetical protein VFQ65_19500 [Kofleriaceae bacterium]|nr:hypothetical protein [Kofleriaceae bacterium]